MSALKPSLRLAKETTEQGAAYGCATDNRPLGWSQVTLAFGQGFLLQSNSVIGSGVCKYVHGQIMVSPDVGRMRWE